MVDRLKPVDLSNIQDKGMKGAVLLAVAMGWNLVQRDGAPAQVVSREGLKRNIPTDTGVRQSVFWSLIANILSHSDGKLPTPELVEQIVKQTGMSRAHAHVLKSRTALLASGSDVSDDDEPPEEEVGQEGESSEDQTEGHEVEVSPAEVAPSADALEPVEYPITRVEPTLNHMGDGNQYLSPIMETVIRQLIPDGDEQITYRCLVCGLEFPAKRGVGSHYQVHTKAGEAEATAAKSKTVVNKVEGYQPTEIHTPRGDYATENRRLRRIINDVQKAVGQDAIKGAERQVEAMRRRVEAAEAARDEAIARADRLASDLKSLKELIGGIQG